MSGRAAGATAAAITTTRLPRQVKLFGAVSLLNDFASEMIYPLLPALVTGVLGAGPQALGALDGAADFAAAFVKLGAGRLADRPARGGRLVVLGYAVAVLVRPVIAFAAAAWQVVGLRVVDRLGKGLRTPPRDALIADVTPPPLRGRAFGLQRGLDHAGAVLGPLVAWWLLASGTANVRRVIGLSIVPGVLVLVLAVWAVRDGQGRTETDEVGRPRPSRPALVRRRPPLALVARTAGARQGSGFGACHGLTGFAALAGGLVLGGVFQAYGGAAAFVASAVAGGALALVWPVIARRGRSAVR